MSATYAGTTGWTSTDTSREQADPTKQVSTQEWVLRAITGQGAIGATVAELRMGTFAHHGQVSSALTNLHRAGRLARLVERRGRCHVYVLPEHVGDRPTQPPYSRAAPDPTGEQARLNELARQEGHDLGWAEGQERGRREVSVAIVQHIDAMRSALGHSQATHSEACWQRHVACALTRVRHEALKAGGRA